MDPVHNEGPRDWKNMFAMMRFRCIEVLLHTFYYCWGDECRSLYRGLPYIAEVRRFVKCEVYQK